MKTLLIAVTALWAAVAAGGACAAEVLHETRAATGFSRIEIDGQADIRLQQGTSEGLSLEATAQGLKQIRTDVRGKTLRISLVDQSHWWQWIIGGSATRTPRITINLIQLERIEASGAVNIIADSLKADELRLDFAGACKLKIGNLQATRLHLYGAGAVKAEIAGKAIVNAKTSLKAEISGAGLVEYAGNPRVERDITGIGKIRRR